MARLSGPRTFRFRIMPRRGPGRSTWSGPDDELGHGEGSVECVENIRARFDGEKRNPWMNRVRPPLCTRHVVVVHDRRNERLSLRRSRGSRGSGAENSAG